MGRRIEPIDHRTFPQRKTPLTLEVSCQFDAQVQLQHHYQSKPEFHLPSTDVDQRQLATAQN